MLRRKRLQATARKEKTTTQFIKTLIHCTTWMSWKRDSESSLILLIIFSDMSLELLVHIIKKLREKNGEKEKFIKYYKQLNSRLLT